MPLNKLENFIKNTEGRILYVNPNDLDATDAIDNQGNSLTKPFKTIQRALLEAARFSYLRGSGNDIVEKTTILLFPGEHVVDNRPGFGIRDNNGAKAVSPSGTETVASTTLTLSSSSIFDLTQEDNILYKFNSINGGVIVPRGTSLVGLDLRKTKIRPKYVPNPTDSNVEKSAIFRVTGACYFWQFSIFDGDPIGEVYTDPIDFTTANKSKPTFSHHKLSCFEYADGVTVPSSFSITDLDMYYSKLSNAYNTETNRNIDQKWPESPLGFAKRRSEYEIVGAFAADPINISSIISGDSFTPGSVITVTTATDHGLTADTPIKIKGVNVDNYNVSTTVQTVTSSTTFTYLLDFVPNNLPAGPAAGLSASNATVTIETDTVQGASPYIFNCSLRSVYGMNGLHADGAKASGFRSLVTAQFTAVSLQKDDRAFVKYDESSRSYNGLPTTKVQGAALSSGASSTNTSTVYHLDPDAVYRPGWETSHIRASNDSFIQVVSVFAIGFTFHFDGRTGADFSITNSNSNFGQFSLNAESFKAEAFAKDNRGYITSVITPKAVTDTEEVIEWLQLDVDKTVTVGLSSHLYLFGFEDRNIEPPIISQGYRIGAKVGDILTFEENDGTAYNASIAMVNNTISDTTTTVALGSESAVKEYRVTNVGGNLLTLGNHLLQTGEKIIIISDTGDLPEKIEPHRVYYAIRENATQIRVASSLTNAQNNTAITLYSNDGDELRVLSRVSDKVAGDVGCPIQYDAGNSHWYIHSTENNDIYNAIVAEGVANLGNATNATYVKRIEDSRSLDEKLYKFRVVIPKELDNCKDPEEGFVIQESSSTGARFDTDFTDTTIDSSDYAFNRNPRFISTCSVSANTVTVVAEQPHNLTQGQIVVVKNVTSTDNPVGTANSGYNGVFAITSVDDDKTFKYSTTDESGVVHAPGVFSNDTSSRTITLPRFERRDWLNNLYIYRNDVITPYVKDVQDGIYHLYVLNAANALTIEAGGSAQNYSQNVKDLYPQLDRDNLNDNPNSSKTFANRSPIGEVVTNDLKKSLTRETTDIALKSLGVGLPITGVSTSFTTQTSGTATLTFGNLHNLSGIVTYSTLTGGSGYTDGTYYNVRLVNDGTDVWDGATARVNVSSGSVDNVLITSGGSGYTDGETLDIDSSVNPVMGGGSGAEITIATSGISTVIGNTVQITGVGTATDGYYRITSVPSSNQVAIAITDGDPTIYEGSYLLNLGSEISISNSSYTASTGISVFTTSEAHGLVVGNKFRVKNSNDDNLGDFIVTDVTTTTVSAKTNAAVTSPQYLMKHGLSSNDRTSDSDGENLGARGLSFYGNETAVLQTAITNDSADTALEVLVPNSGISTTQRFELGSYIQIDNEIMRVVSSTLSGTGNNEITVIRGSLGTIKSGHAANTLIKKILPKAVEFRRPTYLRASGHTFEYLGYGPGNYSTGLPQVQVKTLSDTEDYLAQAQEKSCGVVVYTGMNSVGDFFIGNKKINSSTGTEEVFDIPVPTVTGQDPSNLSVVFDEVIVKERLLVEGGKSKQILSQFDGPVKFNKNVKFNDSMTLDGIFKIIDDTQSESTTSGALVVAGGVGIGKSVNIKGMVEIGENGTSSITFDGDTNRVSTSGGDLNIDPVGDIELQQPTNITGDVQITGITTVTGNSTINGDIDVDGSLDFTSLSDNNIPATSGIVTAHFVEAPNVPAIGSIMLWPGALDTWNSNYYRNCNGSAISRTEFQELFALLGTTYGAGDGSTTFNLPNFDKRTIIGADGSTGYALGEIGGAPDAVLIGHNHNLIGGGLGGTTTFVSDVNANLANEGVDSGGAQVLDGVVLNKTTETVNYNQPNVSSVGQSENGQAVSTESGEDKNYPPYVSMYYIIRVR